MPWDASDAQGKTHRANTPGKRQAWSRRANAILKETGDEGKAIRIANWMAKKRRSMPRRKKH
jgi:hypothetical protein